MSIFFHFTFSMLMSFYCLFWLPVFCLFVCCFLGLHPWHTEVSRLGVEMELWLQQSGVWAVSVTYTTAHGNDRSLTHWARPEIEPTFSWILVRFISTVPQREFLCLNFLKCKENFYVFSLVCNMCYDFHFLLKNTGFHILIMV